MRLALLFTLFAGLARADGVPGAFDYYVLSLSWQANWCALEGDTLGAPQCDPTHDFGWVLHGLWPQYESGWPADCPSAFAAPGGPVTSGMADITGSAGSAAHQWRRHGTCSGLPPEAFFALARNAYDAIARPEALRRLRDPVRIRPGVIENAFLQANPGLAPEQITITCREGHIQEARICLTRDLEFRDCGADVARDCTLPAARLEPVR